MLRYPLLECRRVGAPSRGFPYCALGGAPHGASIFSMTDTLRGYVRRADLFHEHAGAVFL